VTTIRQIVTEAFRESNLTQVGDVPDGAEYQEAEAKLLSFIRSVFGSEFGENLYNIHIHETGFSFRPNSRLIVDSRTVSEIQLPSRPQDGERFAVVDPRGLIQPFAPLRVFSNTGTIEGDNEVILDTPNAELELFYRADMGQWKVLSPLTSDDQLPFPAEFDDFFILWLAFRLNPRFGVETRPESVEMYRRIRKLFMARYKQVRQQMAELGLVLTPGVRNRTYDTWDTGQTTRIQGGSGDSLLDLP
jgi:hypothetical protein